MSVSKAQSKESTYNEWLLLYADTLSNNFSAELEEIGVASSNPTVIFLKVNKLSELVNIYMYIYTCCAQHYKTNLAHPHSHTDYPTNFSFQNKF
jgi:hypothetical protein